MPREVELRPRCEDAHAIGIGIVLRQDEGRFAEIEFASDLLHTLGRNARRVRQNRELITAERCRTENIDDVKCVLHEINLRLLPQALTTSSIAWLNGPTGGVSSGEVTAVLLMANSFGYRVRWSGWWSPRLHALPMPCGRQRHP